VATRFTGSGRVTLAGSTLIEVVEGARTETEVGPTDIDTTLAGRFGIVLERGRSARMPG
jgi:hypothetical protein